MNINELHRNTVIAADSLCDAQAKTDAERAANDGLASKPTRQAEKSARKEYDKAMSAFQNAVEELDAFPANLAEMYSQIGKVRL